MKVMQENWYTKPEEDELTKLNIQWLLKKTNTTEEQAREVYKQVKPNKG